MKSTPVQIFLYTVLLLFSTACRKESKKSDLVLWYNKPASDWNEALPVGNGRMGAMIFGGISEEHLQLNENTLYSGEPSQNYKNVSVTPGFDKVMKLLRDGKNAEADEYVRKGRV